MSLSLRTLTFGIILLSASFLMTGCFNSYTGTYRSYVSADPLLAGGQVGAFSGTTSIVASTSSKDDSEKLVREGYVMLGESTFNDEYATASIYNLQEHALKIGADKVLYADHFIGTTSGVRAQEIPGESYRVRDENGKKHWENGPSQIVYVPYTVSNYSHWASFWRKGAPPIFGVLYSDLPDAMRQTLQRNTGVLVTGVVEGSPAFLANILPGDVITHINARPISTTAEMDSLKTTFAGTYAQVELLRGGKPLMISLTMNRLPPPLPVPVKPVAAPTPEKVRALNTEGPRR